MKKLLLLNSCLLFLFFGCCHHAEKSVAITAQMRADSARAADSFANHVSSSGTVGNDKGIMKDTTNKPKDNIPIIHSSQNQAKVDSIKNAKEKEKNPK